MEENLVARLDACERTNRHLSRLLWLQAVALAAVVVSLLAGRAMAERVTADASSPQTLRVSELVVVDPAGVERVRIAGKLPGPRGGQEAAGVLLYDGTGQERGGYVTWEPSGNVGLTLDSRQGQVTLFVAGPDPGSALQLWHGKDLIELRSDDDGSRLTGVKEGKVVVQQPEIRTLKSETCAVYREAASRLSAEQVLQECRRRFTDSACGACLGPR